jgi:hypothetical protein
MGEDVGSNGAVSPGDALPVAETPAILWFLAVISKFLGRT